MKKRKIFIDAFVKGFGYSLGMRIASHVVGYPRYDHKRSNIRSKLDKVAIPPSWRYEYYKRKVKEYEQEHNIDQTEES